VPWSLVCTTIEPCCGPVVVGRNQTQVAGVAARLVTVSLRRPDFVFTETSAEVDLDGPRDEPGRGRPETFDGDAQRTHGAAAGDFERGGLGAGRGRFEHERDLAGLFGTQHVAALRSLAVI